MSSASVIGEDPNVHSVLEGHKKGITSISFNPDKNQFASSSEDHSIMIWTNYSKTPEPGPSYRFSGHEDAVTCIDFSPNSRQGLLASSSKDCTVRLWVPTILGDCKVFKAHTSAVNSVHFSPAGLRLLTASNDKSVKTWDVETRQFCGSFIGHNHWVTCARYSPDGQLVSSCSDDRTVRIWDTTAGEQVHVFAGTKGTPKCVAIHSNSNTVAVATDIGILRIYDIRTKKLLQHYLLHDSVTCVDWHPKANYMLTGGLDGKLRIVDIMEGRPLYTLSDSAHCAGVKACKFSTCGEFFVSGGIDATVIVWKTNFV